MDGELSKEQYTKLLALFTKYQKQFMKFEGVKGLGFDEIYKSFLKMFRKVVRARSADAR